MHCLQGARYVIGHKGTGRSPLHLALSHDRRKNKKKGKYGRKEDKGKEGEREKMKWDGF